MSAIWYPVRMKKVTDSTEVGDIVFFLVRDMELAFATGTASRNEIKYADNKKVPFAARNIDALTSAMFERPWLGWSCWEMSTLFVELLRQRGVVSGITIGLGAEPGAPVIPHSIVRVKHQSGFIYADPHFGLPGMSFDMPVASSVQFRSQFTRSDRHALTTMLHVNDKSSGKDYSYHIQDGILTPEQLLGNIYQAEFYGGNSTYIRGVYNDHVFTAKRDEDAQESTLKLTKISELKRPMESREEPVIETLDWSTIEQRLAVETSQQRYAAIQRLIDVR